MRNIFIVLGCVVVFGILALVAMGSNAPENRRNEIKFDYATATPDARQAWLDKEIIPLGKQIDRNLPKGRGNQVTMAVDTVKAVEKHNLVTVNVKISGPYRLRGSKAELVKAYMKSLCRPYFKTPLGKNEIVIRHVFSDTKGRKALEFTLSPSRCRAATKKAA